MHLPSRQQPWAVLVARAALLPRALPALLLGVLPGALLMCILHCSWSSDTGLERPIASPFLCHEPAEPDAALPLSISVTVVQSLVQSVTTAFALVVPPMVMLRLRVVPRAFAARLADAPPAPPPRG